MEGMEGQGRDRVGRVTWGMVMRHAEARRGGKIGAGGAEDTDGRAKRVKGVGRPGMQHEAEGWDSA